MLKKLFRLSVKNQIHTQKHGLVVQGNR